MNHIPTPDGMNRRHFLRHLTSASALAGPALALSGSIRAHAKELSRGNKSCILLWMGGGPPTIDMWDLKPSAATGGPFSAINTKGDLQVCEHLPLLANQMQHLSVIRSMSTSEADHERGTYYMHTGYKPNPNVEHPSYGSVVAHQLEKQIPELEIPPFVSIGGSSEGPGFLGMAYAPFEVSSSGRVRNLQSRGVEWQRLQDRMLMLESLEKRFIRESRGYAAEEHAKVLSKTYDLLTSKQLDAFKVRSEPEPMRERYGDTGFGRGCLMARRLVEAGVPFIEVNFGGWDLHDDCFNRLETKLPELDKSMSALVSDLVDRGLWENTVVLCMGEFGRTPRINGDAGRDHFARAWSVVAGGGGIQGGRVIGQTSTDGTRVETDPYSSEDLMATVCQGMGISLKTTFTANNGRPMKIAGGGRPIADLFT